MNKTRIYGNFFVHLYYIRGMKTFSEIFYESTSGKRIWTLYGDSMKETFRGKMIDLEFLLTSPKHTDKYREEKWMAMRRLEWGYNIFNNSKPTNSGLCSKKCYNYIKYKKSNKLVKDHFYGVTESANEVRREFEKSKLDITYMVNEWLPKNYHLFVTWHVTPEEHKGENIKRAKHSLLEKDTFQHLVNVSEVVEKKTRKQLLK